MLRPVHTLPLMLALFAGSADAQLTTLGVGVGTLGASCADANWPNVKLLVFNDSATNGTSVFIDQSTGAKSATKHGTPAYSNGQAPPGMASSVLFNGSSDWITWANSADWRFGSGEFTVEFWAYLNSAPASGTAVLVSTQSNNGIDEFAVDWLGGTALTAYSQDGVGWFNGGSWLSSSLSTSTWTHFAFYKSGSNYYSAINGVVTNVGPAVALFGTSSPLSAACQVDGFSGYCLPGYMASLRVTKGGTARYGASNFTPPSLPLPTC